MNGTLTTSTPPTKSTGVGWLVLLIGSLVAFVIGALAQLGVYLAFGLCMESSEEACEPGTWPTTLEFALATVPTYLIWLTPSVIAALLGYRYHRAGNPAGRALLGAAIGLGVLITVACSLMWWL